MSDGEYRSERMPLVIVDDSDEMQAALDYACHHVRSNGGTVALLRVVEPQLGQLVFARTSALMDAEARGEAAALLDRLAADVTARSGQPPQVYVRAGEPCAVVRTVIEEKREISSLVLAAHTGPRGPGPLVTALTGKHMGGLRVPVTIIPGNLSGGQIAAFA